MKTEKNIFNDEIDLITLLAVLFDNFNLIISIFFASLLIVIIYYFSSTNLYQSDSLIEIKSENSTFLPESLTKGINSGISSGNSLQAEIEIYRSNNTVADAIENLKKADIFDDSNIPSPGEVKSNLSVSSTKSSKSLINISYVSDNPELSEKLLNLLNEEFISDRRNFIKQSSSAGKQFISQEIPRIKTLLKEAEDNLNSFRVSTNVPDVIFDTNNQGNKLERLRNRVNEIEFKELELKEFYKENHPIYLTLTQQKKLVLNQIGEIENNLPNVPTTQRTLENFKREVEIYSNVLRELSSQELSLGMTEASSLSNVRIINEATGAYKISPQIIILLFSVVVSLVAYLVLLLIHFLGDKVSNFDALSDFVGKENIIGELPDISGKNDKITLDIADELMNKTIYEITHSKIKGNSIAIVSSVKAAGKTELSERIYEKMKSRYKVCLLDLDYRKTKGKDQDEDEKTLTLDDILSKKDTFFSESSSMRIPPFKEVSLPDFFTSEGFIELITLVKKEFDFVICDTPPWKLFVDAKIISEYFDKHIYVVCNKVSSFKDINIFLKEVSSKNTVQFFYNRFNLYFNFLWLKYQYPYYSKNYYYEYSSYGQLKKNLNLMSFLVESATKLRNILSKWVKSILNRLKRP